MEGRKKVLFLSLLLGIVAVVGGVCAFIFLKPKTTISSATHMQSHKESIEYEEEDLGETEIDQEDGEEVEINESIEEENLDKKSNRAKDIVLHASEEDEIEEGEIKKDDQQNTEEDNLKDTKGNFTRAIKEEIQKNNTGFNIPVVEEIVDAISSHGSQIPLSAENSKEEAEEDIEEGMEEELEEQKEIWNDDEDYEFAEEEEVPENQEELEEEEEEEEQNEDEE